MAYSNGKTKLGKIFYDVFLTCPSSDFSTNYTRIGACTAEPSMKDQKGDTVKTNDGMDNVISKNDVVEFVVIEVTKANFDSLRTLINKNATVIFIPKPNALPDSGNTEVTLIAVSGAWKMNNLNIFPEPAIVGNTQNQIACSATVEIGAYDTTNLVAY